MLHYKVIFVVDFPLRVGDTSQVRRHKRFDRGVITMIDAPRNRNTLPKLDKTLDLVEVEVIWDVNEGAFPP